MSAPNFQRVLRAWQWASDPPKQVSIGHALSGGWATAELKEFPPALNGAIAEGLFSAIEACETDAHLQIAEAFHNRCAPMLCSHFGGPSVQTIRWNRLNSKDFSAGRSVMLLSARGGEKI